jgi:hypothetical protein
MSSIRRFRLFVAILCLLTAGMAAAQEEPNTPQPRTAADKEPPAREQTIYIPYTKLRQIFEKEGRGVFVPYDEFQRLWKAAREATKKPDDPKSPLATLIAEIDSQATVSRDVMTVAAKLQIEVLTPGWHYVHLRLNDAAIQSAQIGENPARIIFEAGKGYWVLVEKKGREPEKIELKLQYSKAFSKQPGANNVEFEAPQAAVNRWQIRIPEQGVKVKVEPNIAASDERPDPPAKSDKKETLLTAVVGAADKVRIEWTAKAEGAAGLAALVTVQARQEITIDEGVVHTRATLAYDIQRADVTQLTIEVPADQNVVNVFDPNVQKWEKNTEGAVQTLTIALFQPTRGNQNILIELEKFAGDKDMPQEMTHADIRAPVVRAAQAGTPENMNPIGRQQGVVVARLGSSLRGEATSHTGLLQIDAAELPPAIAKQPWTFAYRYAALPFDLVLSVEKLLPHIEADELVEVYLEPHQITADLLAVLNIERAGIFQLQLDVPAGYEVRSVQGREHAGATAAVVDSHHLEDVEYTPDPAQPDVKAKQRTRLVVMLARRAAGKVALAVELIKRQDDTNLLQPTGAASNVALPLPRVAPASVARTSGRLLVYSPESLRANPQEVKGLAPIAPAEAVQTIPSTRNGRFPQLREIAAYAYTGEPAGAIIAAERRKPYIEARELLAAHVESGVIRYEATFVFDIRYSSVRSLRLDVPAASAADIRNLTPQLRDQRIEPQPADVAEGYVAWQLAGDGELLGSVTAKFSWEKKLGELPVGTAVAIDLPQIKAIGVDRFWGQIVASKAETIEISVKDEPKGLRPIDPQHDLMAGAKVHGAARAFEFHENWTLGLAATRYQLEEVKRTSIDRAFVRMVVTRGDQVTVQALYRLRSARQRVPLRIPGVDPKLAAGALDARPLKINNQPAPLEHDGTQFFIPLVGHTTDEPLLVELRYTVPGSPALLELPEFPEDPAMQQVDLAVYLPEEWQLLGVRGPWSNEEAAGISRVPSQRSIGTRSVPATDDELLARVRVGIASCETAGSDFPLDGTRHLLSTSRPEPGPSGALRLVTAHRNAVNAVVFLLVAIVGLILTPRQLGTRLWWFSGLVIGIVLAAVFAPTLAEAILKPPLWIAIGLVFVVWIIRSLAWLLPGVVAYLSTRFQRPVVVSAPIAQEGVATNG